MSDGEFICDASAMAKALRDVVDIVKKDSIAILNNVLIETTKTSAKFTATTMDTMISRTIPATAKKPGTLTLPAIKFRDVVGAMPSGSQAKVAFTDKEAVLTCGRSRFRFGTLPATDFPKLPFENPEASYEAGQDFIDALGAVRHAFASDGTQYWLCGAFVHKRDGILRVVGLDGLRLSLRTLGPIDTDIPDTIITTPVVNLLLKLADDNDRAFLIEFGDKRIRCLAGDVEFIAKTVDQVYPKFDHIIPADQPLLAKVDNASITSALNRIQILSDDKERTVRLDFAKDKVTISNRGDGDSGMEEVPCDYAGEDLSIAFRGQQLRDALAATDADTIEIGMSGPLAPMLMTGRENALCVISAMRS